VSESSASTTVLSALTAYNDGAENCRYELVVSLVPSSDAKRHIAVELVVDRE
jgi:hypothetical protein